MRDFNPFEGEARARVNRQLNQLGLVEPNYYFGQFELKGTLDSFRDLREFADQYGGEIEIDHDAGSYYSGDSKVFTIIEIQGIKVYLCAFASQEDIEAHGL
ncbi:hypothetical protein [Glycomyces sp. NPDC021274]|uniref:hypothetical protein n=1 Tax=Glycomyces sp. NPDC021274 TaxID=3155120 RepID=UPI0034033083